MKNGKKVLAILLTFATLLGIFSCGTTVFAEEYTEYAQQKAYQEELLTQTIETESEKAEIVCEVPEKRDEFSKTYKRADGSYTSVVSHIPLHKQENGEWKNIDNTLKADGTTITNADGVFDIEFPETITDNEKITINNGNATLSFTVNDIENAEGIIEEANSEKTDVITQDMEKTTANITYENVDENTDIQYTVSPTSVKENIIVANKESVKTKYSFDIEKGNLVAEYDTQNNLLFKNEKGEIVFTIPAPVMTDSANAVSYDIVTEIENADESVLTLTYTPSQEWLNSSERAYPVIIDPVIAVYDCEDTVIEDTVILDMDTDPTMKSKNFSDAVEGYILNNNGINGEVLVKFNMDCFSFAEHPNIVVTDANYYGTGFVMGGNILVKPINNQWNSKEITYEDVYPTDNTEPVITYGEDIIDYYTGVPQTEDVDPFTIHFNVTALFNGWLSGEIANNGFALVAEDDKTSGVMYLAGYMLGDSSYRLNSFCAIDYVDTACANDSYEYLTQQVGRAGAVNVNTFSRGLSLSRSDLSMSGLRMPVDIGFNYNSAFNSLYNIYKDMMNFMGDNIEAEFPYGNNWSPSYLQGIVQIVDNQFIFFTEEGTIVTFNQKTEEITEDNVTTTEIIFEADETSDSGYTLELIDQSADVSYENMQVTTPDGEILLFDDCAMVCEIREPEANEDGTYDKINIAYDPDADYKIDYVTDGIGRKYDFVYNATTGLLAEIKCLTADGTPIKAGTTNIDLKTTYAYDSNGNLTTVAYPDGETASYTYDSQGRLVKVQNIDGYNIQYTYDSLGKVTHIAEYAGTTPGNRIDLTQLSNRQVKVADSFSGTQIYQFGKDGKLHYTFDENGNYLKSDYAPANDENVFSSYDWEISAQNLLKNGGFEEIQNAKALDWSNSFIVEDIESSDTITDYACRATSTEPSYETQKQTVNVDGGKAYTFSLYAKSNAETLNNYERLYMRITAEDEDGNETSKSINLTPGTSFEQYSITISTDEEISAITVEFGFKNKSGDFYVNNAQLEKGNGTAPYNYIKNGSFNNSFENWTTATIVDETLNNTPVKAVKLSGGLPEYTASGAIADHISATTQSVKINGKKGNVYSVGGWFKGAFDDNYIYQDVPTLYVPLQDQLTNSSAQIKVTYSYLNEEQQTVTENFVVDFAPHNHGWQYALDTFALKGDTEYVDVTILAKNIIEDSFVTGFTFTQNFESTIDEETDESEESATENCSCNCEDCYFGENCPCTGAINNDCQCPECLRKETSTQDNFGNTLSNKSTDGISYIETISQYTSDGNNPLSYTDENGNTVTYDYNTLNGVLKSVTTLVGTENETSITSYSYDAMGNVVSVSTTKGNNQYQSLQYVYNKDRLYQIITPNGKYRIIYDDWGQVRSVNVVTGSGEVESLVPLVEYTYNDGINRTQVKTATYKNSSENIACYEYFYYDNGALKKVLLNGEEIHYISYDNLGALTKIKNNNGRTVEYTDNGTYIYNADDVCIYSTQTSEKDGTVTEYVYGTTYKTFDTNCDYDAATGITTTTDKIEINSTDRITQETDSDYFGRIKSQNISVYNITNETEQVPATLLGKINTYYEYAVEEDGKTSSSIEKLINKTYNGDSQSARVFDGYYYEYDKQNKISVEKTLNADGTTTDKYSYEYDKLGQLVRFNDAVENKTYTYTYDNNGNILTKSEYAYTTGDLGTATKTTTYGYDTQWKDQLKTIDNQEIKYDNIGNPISYNGATLTWEGRQLKSYETEEQKLQYEYDENGMRYRTTIVNQEDNSEGYLDYVWLGEKLVSMVFTAADSTSLSAKYLYNSNDEIIGFHWANNSAPQSTYYYLKNLQGDITGIVTASGKKELSFSYDVWGKMSTQYHANTSLPTGTVELINQLYISMLNPFGYRGYCYDGYTELYYLQSRYYDPNTGRFINADDTNYLNATGTVLGCNLFAYCENDPVNFVDGSGKVGTPIQWACAIIGGIIGIPFGKWLANKLGYTSGATYTAIRAAAVVGGAALGWFSASLLIKLVKLYVTNNPQILIKIVAKHGPNILEKARVILGISKSVVATAVPYSWQNAEEILRRIIGSVTSTAARTLKTPYGDRICDALNKTKKLIGESKYGYQGLSDFIKKEIVKDAFLVKKGYKVEWHFFISQATGKGGPSGPLRIALENANIKIVLHF